MKRRYILLNVAFKGFKFKFPVNADVNVKINSKRTCTTNDAVPIIADVQNAG